MQLSYLTFYGCSTLFTKVTKELGLIWIQSVVFLDRLNFSGIFLKKWSPFRSLTCFVGFFFIIIFNCKQINVWIKYLEIKFQIVGECLMSNSWALARSSATCQCRHAIPRPTAPVPAFCYSENTFVCVATRLLFKWRWISGASGQQYPVYSETGIASCFPSHDLF